MYYHSGRRCSSPVAYLTERVFDRVSVSMPGSSTARALLATIIDRPDRPTDRQEPSDDKSDLILVAARGVHWAGWIFHSRVVDLSLAASDGRWGPVLGEHLGRRQRLGSFSCGTTAEKIFLVLLSVFLCT
jgi:hypothetical protein